MGEHRGPGWVTSEDDEPGCNLEEPIENVREYLKREGIDTQPLKDFAVGQLKLLRELKRLRAREAEARELLEGLLDDDPVAREKAMAWLEGVKA